MTMLVDLSAVSTSFGELKEQLTAAGAKIGVEVRLMREEIFKSMHRV